MPTLAEKIEQKCQAFARELAELVTSTVAEAFGRPAPAAAVDPRRVPRDGAVVRRIPPRRIPKPKAGAKRSPEHLAALCTDLGNYVTNNPGQRIEQIAAGMNLETRELVLPAKKLIADGSVRTKGEKLAMRYWPRGQG